VEGNQVLEIGLNGEIRQQHVLDRLELQDVAMTLDEERMLGVATLVASKGGLQPSMSRSEKRVVGMYGFSSRISSLHAFIFIYWYATL
jgi:hypothetical protein